MAKLGAIFLPKIDQILGFVVNHFDGLVLTSGLIIADLKFGLGILNAMGKSILNVAVIFDKWGRGGKAISSTLLSISVFLEKIGNKTTMVGSIFTSLFGKLGGIGRYF